MADTITVTQALELKASAARALTALERWLAPEDRTGRCIVQTLYLWHSALDWGPLRLVDATAQERGYKEARGMATRPSALAASAANKACHRTGLRIMVRSDGMLSAAFAFAWAAPSRLLRAEVHMQDGTFTGAGKSNLTLSPEAVVFMMLHLLKVHPDSAEAYAAYAAWGKTDAGRRWMRGGNGEAEHLRFAMWVDCWWTGAPEDGKAAAEAARTPLEHAQTFSKCTHLGREVWAGDKVGARTLNNLIYWHIAEPAVELGNSYWGEAQEFVMVHWGGVSYGFVRAKWYRKWERCPAAPHLVRVRTSPSRKRARAMLDLEGEEEDEARHLAALQQPSVA